MRNLVAYRQSLTIATGKWNPPCRKEEEGWILIKRDVIASLYDHFVDGSFPLAILKMKKKMEKMRTENNSPIWSCKMTSKQSGGYRIYHLICRRAKLYVAKNQNV